MDPAPLVWEAPGKGDWRGLHDHFPRALTRPYQRLLAQGMEHGEGRWFADYGLPARTLQPAFIHGRVFVTAAPLVGPASDAVPPAFALRLALRLVPAFRRRVRAAAAAMGARPWLAETRHWYEVERPEWEARNRALDDVDVAGLDDDELARHLRAALANAEEGYREHFRLHGADLIPTGMFLGRAAEWGISAMDAAALLAGSSPASVGDRPLPAWRLVTGYDLAERCAAELPSFAVLTPGSRQIWRDPGVKSEREGELRARVPAADREEWDRLLADARATYGLRDDNGMLTAAWPVGLLRRAYLEVGRRMAARGALAEPEHAVELTVDELLPSLSSSVPQVALNSTMKEMAAARLAERRRLSEHPAPLSLGKEADLPMHALPPAMRRMTSALLMLRAVAITGTERAALQGIGIGDATATGRACVASDPAAAFERFEPGDILVTVGTCPAWNTVLALAGGVVTEEGGPLSHAAVIARELGLPAVVGAADAVALIPDGARVELDPVAGRVVVLDR